MSRSGFDVVTGAFGYTGKYITRRLLARGRAVLTLTGHPQRSNPFGPAVRVAPFNFTRPDALAASLEGADTLYNTYWVRFAHGHTRFEHAVENSRTLIHAASQAGLRRIVHVSITNPSPASSLPYFRGKALVEEFITRCERSYAILRPAVVFGDEDILINNIAWLLRKIPFFAIPGSGKYRVQPIYVEDLAEMAVTAGQGDENVIRDAVGPETFTFNELVWWIAAAIDAPARVIHVPPWLALLGGRTLGLAVRDVLLTRDEVVGLMSNLLVSDQPPTGTTRLSDWLVRHADQLGRQYASELRRHYGA